YHFDEDGTYACWMGHGTLPKINHADRDVRHAMVEGPDSVVGRWLRPPFDLDGWRIDVANMTGRLGAVDVNHDVARAVRATARALRADPWVIGEHNHDASGDLDGDGWHGTMNYSGFSWPVWSWLRAPASPARETSCAWNQPSATALVAATPWRHASPSRTKRRRSASWCARSAASAARASDASTSGASSRR
ncbi:MAG: alpha-amylase family glycosyl hydrolase, partial [Actinomycetes bacterium]